MIKLKNPLIKKRENLMVWKVFLTAMAIGIIMILPFIIKDKGYFFYYGDYNVQQVPFWQYCAEQIKSGNFLWSWETDLGSDFISSYSFYTIGSPFFWLAMIFPSSWMPALMGPLMMLKMAVAAVGAFLFMRRYLKDPDYAMIGALLYAFSSYTVYNIFFNHFIDVVAVFPFMLLSFDLLFEEDKWGWFALFTAINVLTNYFFFVGQVVFFILYYVLRVTCPDDWKFSFKKLLHGIAEALIGVAISAFMMLPSFLELMSNPRLNSVFNGWGFYIYGETRRYMGILHAMLFPPELPHFTYFIEDSNTRWQSVAAWLPLFALSMVIAFLAAKKSKGSWQKRVLICFGVALLMPGVGSIFYLMKAVYYSRWLYMAVMVMALITVKVLEDYEDYDLKLGMKWNAIFTLFLLVPIAFLPVISGDNTISSVGLYVKNWGAPIMFAINACITVACMVILYLLYDRLLKKGKTATFKKYVSLSLVLVICIYSLFILTAGKASSESTKVLVDDSLNAADLQIPGAPEDEFYRIDVLDGLDNQGLYWRKSSINFFHSVVSPSIMEFYEFIGEERNVASRPSASRNGLRSITSVKYIFEKEGKTSYQSLYNTTYLTNMNGYDVYVNNNYIPFGFTYKDFILEYDAKKVDTGKISDLMVYAMVLDDETAGKYSYLFDSQILYPSEELDLTSAGFNAAVEVRKTETAYNYSRSNKGYSVDIDLAKDNLVFFSVPFESGWSATVNGEPTSIMKANAGLTAVLAKSGHNHIEFTYTVPGLEKGLIISAAGLVLMIGLFVIGVTENKKKKRLAALEPAFIPGNTAESELAAIQTAASEPVNPEPPATEPTVTAMTTDADEQIGAEQPPQEEQKTENGEKDQ